MGQIYTYEEVKNGFHGLLNDSRSDRIGLASVFGFFSAKITGTSAKIIGRDFDDMIEVSVDGAEYTFAPNTAGEHTLFDGLSDIEHDVTFRQAEGFGLNNGWIVKDGNYCIEVNGASPTIETLSNKYTLHSPTLVSSGITKAVGNTAFNTEFYRDRLAGQNVSTSNVMFKTSATEILVCFHMYSKANTYLFYTVDGGDINSVAVDESKIVRLQSSGEHTFNMWAGAKVGGSGQSDIVSIQASSELEKVGARLDQFGDSITEGVTTSSNVHVEIHQVAAHFGRLGQTYGRSGIQVDGLLAALPSYNISNLLHADDIALLTVGRNSLTIHTDTSIQNDYRQTITELLELGYKKVLCRGILPEINDSFAVQSEKIKSIVNAYNDNRVSYIDVSTWLDIDTSDGVHPSPTGYQQMSNYAKVAYDKYLNDDVKPIINLTPDALLYELNVGDNFLLPTAFLTDSNLDDNLTIAPSSNNVDMTSAGTYSVVYSGYTDLAGNIADKVTIIVNVTQAMVTNLKINVADIPNGDYNLLLVDQATSTIVHNEITTFLDESVTLALDIETGTVLKGFVDDNSNTNPSGCRVLKVV